MKKKLAIVAAVVAVASLAAYGTLAAFTAEETAHNIITAGSVQIELLDKTLPPDEDPVDPGFNVDPVMPEATDEVDPGFSVDPVTPEATDEVDPGFVHPGADAILEMPNFNDVYPYGMPVMPGTYASKVVAVQKLDDSADCWIRIQLTPAIQWADGEDHMSHPMEVVHLDLNLGDGAYQWTQGEDGWYYYNSPLTADEPFTTALFTSVHFDGPAMGNDYQNSTFTITVDAQAIQWAHTGDSAQAAFGLMAVPEETPEAPESTETPESTESPEITETPESTESPEVTETPESTETPGEGESEPTPPAAGDGE